MSKPFRWSTDGNGKEKTGSYEAVYQKGGFLPPQNAHTWTKRVERRWLKGQRCPIESEKEKEWRRRERGRECERESGEGESGSRETEEGAERSCPVTMPAGPAREG